MWSRRCSVCRSTKLSLLVVELCERGRFDKVRPSPPSLAALLSVVFDPVVLCCLQVCGLPWSKGDGRDEMDVVEGVLRAYARFVFIEGESTYESAIVTAGMQQRQYSRGEWDALNHKQRRRSRGSDGGRRLLEDRCGGGSQLALCLGLSYTVERVLMVSRGSAETDLRCRVCRVCVAGWMMGTLTGRRAPPWTTTRRSSPSSYVLSFSTAHVHRADRGSERSVCLWSQVRVRNYRGAATEMYRLCKRLDAGTAFEDDMLRLNKKIEALAQVNSRTTYSKQSI